MWRTVKSNVPPPRSNTQICFSPICLPKPYAKDALVGSLMIRITSSPAMRPASLVALRCESLKYAGTVITALVTGWPRNASASRRSSASTIALISGGEYVFSPSWMSRSSRSFSCGTTV